MASECGLASAGVLLLTLLPRTPRILEVSFQLVWSFSPSLLVVTWSGDANNILAVIWDSYLLEDAKKHSQNWRGFTKQPSGEAKAKASA